MALLSCSPQIDYANEDSSGGSASTTSSAGAAGSGATAAGGAAGQVDGSVGAGGNGAGGSGSGGSSAGGNGAGGAAGTSTACIAGLEAAGPLNIVVWLNAKEPTSLSITKEQTVVAWRDRANQLPYGVSGDVSYDKLSHAVVFKNGTVQSQQKAGEVLSDKDFDILVVAEASADAPQAERTILQALPQYGARRVHLGYDKSGPVHVKVTKAFWQLSPWSDSDVTAATEVPKPGRSLIRFSKRLDTVSVQLWQSGGVQLQRQSTSGASEPLWKTNEQSLPLFIGNNPSAAEPFQGKLHELLIRRGHLDEDKVRQLADCLRTSWALM